MARETYWWDGRYPSIDSHDLPTLRAFEEMMRVRAEENEKALREAGELDTDEWLRRHREELRRKDEEARRGE